VKERDLDVKTASDLASALGSDNNVVRCLFREVEHLLQPCSNASSERSFSSLRHLKTYLRSTMTQQRLTHTAMMKVHAAILQGLDLQTLMNSFVSKTPERIAVFGK